jgi:phage repressor protein C with HTH and peptisase S24 domain
VTDARSQSIQSIARALGVNAGALLHGTPNAHANNQSSLIPIGGTASAGDDGFWHNIDRCEGFVRFASDDPHAYALQVHGDSMRPRIKPNEFVVVEPMRAVQNGDEVALRAHDGRVMIKVLHIARNGEFEMLSINEDHRPITILKRNVEALHYVAAILKTTAYIEPHDATH